MKTMGMFDSTVALMGTQNGNSTESGFSVETHDRHNAMFMISGKGGGYFNSLGKVVDCNDLAHNDLFHHMANAFGMKMADLRQPGLEQGAVARRGLTFVDFVGVKALRGSGRRGRSRRADFSQEGREGREGQRNQSSDGSESGLGDPLSCPLAPSAGRC